jgi:hypothetical protein
MAIHRTLIRAIQAQSASSSGHTDYNATTPVSTKF